MMGREENHRPGRDGQEKWLSSSKMPLRNEVGNTYTWSDERDSTAPLWAIAQAVAVIGGVGHDVVSGQALSISASAWRIPFLARGEREAGAAGCSRNILFPELSRTAATSVA